jgi:hypothetical protein
MTRTTRPRSAPNNGRQFFTEPFRNDIDNLKSNLDSKRSIASELRHEIANSREFEESEKNGLMSMFAKNKATQVDEDVYARTKLLDAVNNKSDTIDYMNQFLDYYTNNKINNINNCLQLRTCSSKL